MKVYLICLFKEIIIIFYFFLQSFHWESWRAREEWKRKGADIEG